MQTMCGQKLNMKWKDIYTAELRLNSPVESLVTNSSDQDSSSVQEAASKLRAISVTSGLSICNMAIESWDFQDRIMFYFKDVHFIAKCSEAVLEVFDGSSSKVPPVPGKCHLPFFLISSLLILKDDILKSCESFPQKIVFWHFIQTLILETI